MNIKKDSKLETVLQTSLENKAPDTSRRKALKLTAGGSILSGAALTNGVWTKPVIDAVLLPAHAQTSMMTMMTFGANVTVTTTTPKLDRNSILDLFVTPVHAENGNEAPINSLVGFQAYAMQTGEDEFDFQFLLEASQECKIFDKGQATTETSTVAFIEVSASAGSGLIPKQIVCADVMDETQPRSAISGDFTYEVNGTTLMVTANFTGFMFDLDDFEFSMEEGGAPLVDPGCTFCPAPDFDDNGNGAGPNGNGANGNGDNGNGANGNSDNSNGAGPNGNGAGTNGNGAGTNGNGAGTNGNGAGINGNDF